MHLTTTKFKQKTFGSFFMSLAAAALLLTGCGSDDDDVNTLAATGQEPVQAVTTVPGPAGVIRIDDGGTGGLPIVFVHSFAGDTTHWQAQLDHVRQHRRAIALDLRGHGLSTDSDAGAYAIEDFAADIDAVVSALDVDRFILVGHSLGGAAAVIYAGLHPEKVSGLVLVGTPGKLPQAEADKIVAGIESDQYEAVMNEHWNKLTVNAKPATLDKVNTGRNEMAKDKTVAIIRNISYYDPIPALRAYNGPKLSVITPNENVSYALHRQVQGVNSQTIAGTSHWSHMDKPEEFNTILDEFLDGIAVEAPATNLD